MLSGSSTSEARVQTVLALFEERLVGLWVLTAAEDVAKVGAILDTRENGALAVRSSHPRVIWRQNACGQSREAVSKLTDLSNICCSCQ